MTNQEKKHIRKEILKTLRTQKEEERRDKSQKIEEQFLALPEFQSSQTVLFYASFDGEVDTFALMHKVLHRGKTIALPVINPGQRKIIPIQVHDPDHDLETGQYGILQPKNDPKNILEIKDIDIAIVPGVAFDRQNRRLGRGGGYYDRFLSQLSKDCFTVAFAFDFQIRDNLPSQEHDIPVNLVLSH